MNLGHKGRAECTAWNMIVCGVLTYLNSSYFALGSKYLTASLSLKMNTVLLFPHEGAKESALCSQVFIVHNAQNSF